MSDTENKFAVGDKVTILSVKKVGEVVAVAEDGLYDVDYTDKGGGACGGRRDQCGGRGR